MATVAGSHVRAGTLEELRNRGCTVVTGGGHTIAVFHHQGQVYAVDNRCPHMGFPLERGTVRDGILTCHWHHARFDLSSGGTFDPFADDVPTFPVSVVDGEVWVNPSPPKRDPVERWSLRLKDALEDNVRLVIAKSVLGLCGTHADYRVPLRIGTRFGTTYSLDGWGSAMSILTCAANMLPRLAVEDRPRALYHGLLHVSRECAGEPPRFPVKPLPTGETRPHVLKKWFRNFIEVRDPEGAERSLRTAIEIGRSPESIADMVFSAATDHIYIDGGHVVDFANKAFELIGHIGWEYAPDVLTSLVRGMARARRSEELSSWRHPVDISSLVWKAREELPALQKEGAETQAEWRDEEELVQTILGDDAGGIVDALKQAIRSGASPEALGSAVAHAAFLRMVRFHTANEFGDWETVHNTLTAANALHQALKRAPTVELLRGVFDTAMSIYLDRFLNMPAQHMPESGPKALDEGSLRTELLGHMDVQHRVEEASQAVSDLLASGAGRDGVLATLGHAMLREDSGFHSFQIVDAGFAQSAERRETESGRRVLVAMTRYLASHSPTSRAVGQTFNIAVRLNRGEELYRDI